MTDTTPTPTEREAAWFGAAESLPPSTVHAVITRLSRLCRDEATEGRALPSALLSVAAGHPVGIACRLAERQASMDMRREQSAREQREQHAALLGAGEPDPSTRWEDIRGTLPPRVALALDSLAAHLLASERVWERLSTGTVKVNGAVICEAWKIPTSGLSKRKATERRAQSLLLAASAWSYASVALGNTAPEQREQRAAAAHRWIKRGHSNRSGRVAGAANGSEVRVTRRLSVGAPFTPPSESQRLIVMGPRTEDGQAPSLLITAPTRSVSYRPTAPVKRIRSPRTTDGVTAGVVWGGGGAVGMPGVRDEPRTLTLPSGAEVRNEWHPSQYGAPLGHSDRKRTESGWERDTRDGKAVGRTEREDWDDALAAGRVGLCPTVDDDGLCQCPRTRTRGKACERVVTETRDEFATRSQRARLLGDDAPTEHAVYLHPLARCEAPSEDGRCGCARKAGALVWVAPSPESAGTLRHPSQPRRTR